MRCGERCGSAPRAGGKGWASKDGWGSRRKGNYHPTSPHRGCPRVPWVWPASRGTAFPPSKQCHFPPFPSPAWTCFSPAAGEKVWRRVVQGGKERKQQQVFRHQGDGNEGGFKISKPASAPQSRPALDRLRRGNRCLPGSLRFQKSSHSRQITDDGEECLIPINSQSVINIWASSM